MKLNNIFENILPNSDEEIFDTIIQNQNIKIERIVSYGQTSPVDFWYNQEDDEFVLLLDGVARIEFENSEISLKKGDYLLIPKHKKHRVSYTLPNKPTIWLAIFFVGEKENG